MITTQRLDEILRSVSRLRPLPGSATRILKALDDSRSSATIIAELIALDQALTAYLLRVANSAALSTTVECSSVSEAVMRLGFKQVRSLVLSTMVNGPLSARLNGYRLGDKELWYHSLAAASAAHWLATALHYPDPEKAYVAGLLHDIGKLLLDQYVEADYNQLLETMSSDQIPLWEVEEEFFGINHAAVGGYMAHQWHFPAELSEAIRDHHTPVVERGPQQRLASIVNLANALVPQTSPGLNALEGRVIHPAALQVLHLDEGMIDRYRDRLTSALFTYENRSIS